MNTDLVLSDNKRNVYIAQIEPNYYDSYRSATLPANLLQGQRDFFGAHTFARVDKADGKMYHVEWSKPGRPIVKVK